MPTSIGPGDLLAERYRLDDLLSESGSGRFWRAHDEILSRDVAVHVIAADDPRADQLMSAARRSAVLLDRRILRVLDADRFGSICYVVNEWADGLSLDRLLADGPLEPDRAAWLAFEVGAVISGAHASGLMHSRLNPENVLVDDSGSVRLIGFAVDAALSGVDTSDAAANVSRDVRDLAAVLYGGLTGRWAGQSTSERLPAAPREAGVLLRPRQVTAGVPTALDAICGEVLGNKPALRSRGTHARGALDCDSARGVTDALLRYLGDPSVQAAQEARRASERVGRRRALPMEGLAATTSALNPVPSTPVPPTPVPPTPVPPTPVPATSSPLPETLVNDPLNDTAERSAGDLEARPPLTRPRPVAEPEPPSLDPPPTLAAGSGALGLDPDRTQAEMPIFMGGEVEWLNSEPPAPPPVLPEPEPKPLFAPDPPEGQPIRRPRQPDALGGATVDDREFWPFQPAHAPVVQLPEVAAPPGRSWLRVAAGVAVALLLVLAVGVAYNLGLGRNLLGGSPQASPSPSSTPAVAKRLTPDSVVDFDPQGRPPQENPEKVANVIDGDRATTWYTESYKQQLGPGGLKVGVGFTVDLGGAHPVSKVDLRVVGDTAFTVLLGAEPPPADPGTAGEGTAFTGTAAEGAGKVSITLPEGSTGRYLTVWLTRLPAQSGGFKGEVSEIAVWGQ